MRKRVSNSMDEREYRQAINSNLEQLRGMLPNVKDDSDSGGHGSLSGNSAAKCSSRKLSRSLILRSAVNYIHELEREQRSLKQQNSRLLAQVLGL
jgi:hypothetical protein